MKIIGWIRYGDKAACGGAVVEASAVETSNGIGYTYQGARMACRKNCVIVGGFVRATLSNGRCRVIHGQVTSAGCPLASTLNDIDGVCDESAAEMHPAFVPDGTGSWAGISPPLQEHDQAYDEYFVLMDEKSGAPARNRSYRITLDNNEVIEGYTDEQGRTAYATSDQRVALTIEARPQHEIQVGD